MVGLRSVVAAIAMAGLHLEFAILLATSPVMAAAAVEEHPVKSEEEGDLVNKRSPKQESDRLFPVLAGLFSPQAVIGRVRGVRIN